MGYIHPEEEKHMAKKTHRTHAVQKSTKDENFVGVISPIKIYLKTRRPAVRPGQVMKSERDYNRAALKRKLRTEDA